MSGGLHGSGALIPNRPYLTIKNANAEDIAVIIMRVTKKPDAGFLSIGITTWTIETPQGQELAEITWGKGNHKWNIMTPEGVSVAEVQRLDEPDSEHQTTHQVRILTSTAAPYVVLASFFATPPGTR